MEQQRSQDSKDNQVEQNKAPSSQTQHRQPKTTNYGDAQYWEDRYIKTKGQRFDWLQTFDSCFSIIEASLNHNKESKILNIGCGNGLIQDQLYEAGYESIFNNDISKSCIDEMNQIRLQKNYQNMVYEVMDVQQMSYSDQTFDMVLDKSTIDALMCSDEPIISVCRMVQEVYRVLKPNGIYMVVSYGSPQSRLESLNREHVCFDVKPSQIQKTTRDGTVTHYLYLCTKKPMKVPFSQNETQHFYEKMRLLQDKEYPPLYQKF